MLVLQFGFDPDDLRSPHRFENHVQNRFVYVGTHDTDTTRGWLESLTPEHRELVEEAIAPFGERDPVWGLIRLALASPAHTAMLQAQDILGLGSEARMNDPTRSSGQWRWQAPPRAFTKSLAARLREATEAAGRCHITPAERGLSANAPRS
jgi:4-alpha-glucanotransferase